MRRRIEQLVGSANQQEERILDVNATMQGSLRFEDPINLRINGKFEGSLDTKGRLLIGEKADVRANITGEEVSIAGSVTGNIKASKILRLESSAKLYGDIEAPVLSIKDGAIIVGHIRMERGSNNIAKMMNAVEVAKYLEVDTKKISEWANTGMLPGAKQNGEWFFEKNKVDEWLAQGRIGA